MGPLRHKLLAAAIGCALLTALPVPAAAGGAFLALNEDFYVAGDVIRGKTMTWLKSTYGNGHLDDGPYHAYLVRRHEMPMLPPLPPDAIPVGPVHVDPRGNGRYGMATVEFTLPDLPPGRYWIAHCNDPCTETLGDLMATPLEVSSNATEAKLLTITERLDLRVRSLKARIANRILGARRTTLGSRLAALEEEVAELRAAVEARPVEPAKERSRSSSVTPLLAFVLPAAALGVVLGRRSGHRK